MMSSGRAPPTAAALDAALIAAHQAQDCSALVDLYWDAARAREATGDIDAACFFLTQAYVFALQADDPRAAQLHLRLNRHGREE